jgi:hypothetical protein
MPLCLANIHGIKTLNNLIDASNNKTKRFYCGIKTSFDEQLSAQL